MVENEAFEFSKGEGIILSLKAGSVNHLDGSKYPKFLSVAWLSNFPNEEERLFYGVEFSISMIQIHILSLF